MTNKKYFCYEIFKNIAVYSKNTELSYKPCCFYLGEIKTSNNFNLSEMWNSPKHLKLKSQAQGNVAIPGCRNCYNDEATGAVSRRQAVTNMYENYFKDTEIDLDAPQSMDYSIGNLCNLKCVICGPNNSSSWIPDYQKIHPTADLSKFKFEKFNQTEVTDPTLLKNLVNVHFHGGGEPLLSNNHLNLLKKIKEVKGLGDVHVYYNTNGTQRVSDEVLALWAECELVELYFSLDDIGERFNYQRTGADWDKVTGNLLWYKENMPVNHMFKINCVWGYLNVYYLADIFEWYTANFSTNRLGDPIDLIFQRALGTFDFVSAPKAVLDILATRFKNYPRILEEVLPTIQRNNSMNHSAFWQEINRIDAVRNTDFKAICPEWSQILLA